MIVLPSKYSAKFPARGAELRLIGADTVDAGSRSRDAQLSRATHRLLTG